MKDYYKILGVSKDASEKDIKKAFKKLSIKYHPDKQSGKSEAEKKEAEEKFKEINEAYQALTNPDANNDNDFGGFGGFNGFPFGRGYAPDGWFDPFNQFNGRAQQRQAEPGNSIGMKVPITLEELFNGCKKKVKFERKVRCASCHGDGGTGKTTCPYCHGSGFITNIRNTGFGTMREMTECNHCHGVGSIVEHECKTCNGTGYINRTETVEINIEPGVPQGTKLQYSGKGWESKSPKGQNGDFIVTIVYDIPENYFVNGLDILEEIYVPYYDLLLGCDYTITKPDGKQLKIHIDPCPKEGKNIRLYGEGLKNGLRQGDYYLAIHYQLPDSIDDEERESLEKIKVHMTKKHNGQLENND
jgi:molecular chaperone DnaJ